MLKVLAIAGVVLALAGSGCHRDRRQQFPAAALPDAQTERYQVPLGDAPFRGPQQAKVTIVEYSDFQCPFCARVEPTIAKILADHPRDVKLVWKNNPLPFHRYAKDAAAAALAAHAAGKFFAMHDKLFANQQRLDRASLERYAGEIGLDHADFVGALDGSRYAPAIAGDQREAARFGVRGTPAFFINGRPLVGAQPAYAFEKILAEELANADKAIAAGVALSRVYAALTSRARTEATAPAASAHAPADDKVVYTVPLDRSPLRGKASAKVTIVEFSDFQCPFCARVEPVLVELRKKYGDQLRVVWKNAPLPFHRNAVPAAEAALAAGEQGRFWEMHDKLFADAQHLDAPTFDKYARELGLDVKKLDAALSGHRFEPAIAQDVALAQRLGVHGTPTFFINGHALRGAQPRQAFEAIIERELALAAAAPARANAPVIVARAVTAGRVR